MYTMQTNLVSRPPITASCRRLRIGADGGRLPSSGPHRVAVPHCRRPANLGRMKKHDYPKSYRLEDTSPVTTHRSCRLEEDAAMVNPADKHTKSTRKDKFFEVEMRVRDDDLDEYGVVNNAVYASYIHDARNVLLETLGFNIHLWTSTGNTMALSELHLKYFTPLRSGGRFIVKLRVVQIKGVRIIVDHVIETLPNRKVVMEASATAVCLDKNHRPTRVFPDLVSKINQFFSCENNSS